SSRMGGGSRTHLHGMKKGRRSAPNFTQLISKGSGDRDLRLRRFLAVRIAKHIAAAPDGLDIIGSAAGEGELLAKLADEHVDDLEFRLVHAAIEMVEEHFLGQCRALAEREEL